jgi:antibiotic biosynthesis monooxygenase (ABM) superfamily enzyme
MIRIVIAVDVVPGHEAEWEEQWRMLREVRSHFPGFRGASLLRDSEEPTRYLSLSEWDAHDELARAMRWMTWLSRGRTLPWTQGPLRVYDEVGDSVGETPDGEGSHTQEPSAHASAAQDEGA